MNEKISLREIWRQQLFLTRICFRRARPALLLHIFESVKLDVSIFFEFTWTVNYCLAAAERGDPWTNILWCMVILMAAIALSTVSFAWYKQKIMPKNLPILYRELRMEIYENSVNMDLENYDDPEFYQEFVLCVAESDKCIDRYLETLDKVFGSGIHFLLSVIYCLMLNPPALLLVLLFVPLNVWLTSRENAQIIGARLARAECERRRDYRQRVFYLADYARELRLNREMQEHCKEDFRNSNRQISEINGAYGKKAFLYGFLNEGLTSYVLCHGLLWTLLIFQSTALKSLSYAAMITSANCVTRVVSRSNEIIQDYKNITENSIYLRRIRRLLERQPSLSGGCLPVPDRPSTLSLEHVSFSYPNGREILHDISMDIRPGQKIALVGYNGSGKTTLIKLLMRLYDPTQGIIRCGGADIRAYDTDAYRKSIGVVFQDFKIYAATLKENVLLDLPACTDDEDYYVEKALFDARFTLDDSRLVYQIETPLTAEFEKAGVNLSGGEKQKVAIARTLYRGQNLVIMDEPSSALDPLAEYQLNTALNEIARDKTVIFISHRLSTTRDADCIYMMDDGRIIESGTHRELLARGGRYADMWNIQAGRY